MKTEKIAFTGMEILTHTILLVDDSPVNLAVVVEGLERHGYDVVVAVDGDEALQRAEIASPDLILLDVMMPGMDGIEVCRRLKAQERTRDIPVIFMTSLSGAADKVAGFGAGAVDYVTKPLHVEEVLARVGTHLALHDLKRHLAEKVAVQEDYLDRIAEEHRIAAGYMNKLISLDTLKDPAVRFHLKPAANFSGDLIAAARTPDGRLHLMLADSTGHGLAAALAAMPVIEPFYSMTGKGFGISAIAREINDKVRAVLPVSHFVTAILASIDADGQVVEVWSGGCPPPLMLDGAGKVAYRFKSRHLAMGILPQEQFDASVEYFSYGSDGYSLLMFSDGAIELENAGGEPFGLPRLLSAAERTDPENRLREMTEALDRHCGPGVSNHDDIALVMAGCEVRDKCGEEVAHRHAAQASGNARIGWQFALTLEIEQLKRLDVVPSLLDILRQIETDREHGGDLFLILSEMFNNALEHGVLKLDSGLKQEEDGFEKYYSARAARLAGAETGQIHMHLKKIRTDGGGEFLRIRVKDSGDGFDYSNLADGSLGDNARRHGRGIPLLRSVCRSLQYLGNGSEAVAEFDLADGNR